jgi:hypothetical protein
VPFNLFQGGQHNCQRFALTPFPGSQGIYRLITGGITGKVKSTQTLECQNLPRLQQVTGSGNDITAINRVTIAINQL